MVEWFECYHSDDFLSEARSLSAINDATVAKVLKIVDQPPTVVLEFGERGDLKTFLRQLVGPPSGMNDEDDSLSTTPPSIRLIYPR